jgi:uroporphyrin-III C-methyltransferase/precorrin-2 dehydrogenase/sirohydrochlorin ferrochelatase
MDSFPIFMRLRNRDVLIVGLGEMAAAKRRLLEAAGARVTLAAEMPASLAGYTLVFGASGVDAIDRAVSASARAGGIPVNIVDRSELSDFIMPAVVDRGDVVIGISTNGASPVLAQRVRAWIENALPTRLEELAGFARRFRQAVQTRIPENGARRGFWTRFYEGEGADHVLAGREHQAARSLIRDLNGRIANRAVQGAVEEFQIASNDPDDLTLGMLRALRGADVIVHDDAVPASILDYARRDAGRVLAGVETPDLARERARGRRVVILHAAEGSARIAAGAKR